MLQNVTKKESRHEINPTMHLTITYDCPLSAGREGDRDLPTAESADTERAGAELPHHYLPRSGRKSVLQ